jgi:hypothetical protein
MPYLRMDLDSYDEMASELGDDFPLGDRPSGGFEYESAEGKFNWAKLEPGARVIRDALLAAGAERFRVRYDGGFDEGFAHPDLLYFGDRQRGAKEVCEQLATPELLAQLQQSGPSFADAGGTQAALYALDELAHQLASRLLGDGYGTGEYELYGAFTADLKTGEIVDHEDVEKPASLE